MKIGHEVTAEERDALSIAVGRRLRIGERLSAADVLTASKCGAEGMPGGEGGVRDDS